MTIEEGISYTFTGSELKSLVLLLRQNEAVLDNELDGFLVFLENSMYQAMTIAEAEEFFNERR